MAEKTIQLDILFNTADAATNVRDLKTALKDLKSAALEAGEGSEAFAKITQKAGELNDKISRVNDNIRANTGSAVENAARGLTNLASVGAGAFSTVQGAAVLFGNESKDLEKTLVKLNAAVALTSGLKSLAEAPDIIRDSVNAFKALNLVTKVNEGITFLATAAQTAFAVATGGVTLSMNALKIAIAATGIGLLVVGIGLAVTALDGFSSGVDDAALAQDKFNTSIDNTKTKLEALNLLYDSGNSFLTANLNLLKARGASLEDQNKIETAIFDYNAKKLKSDFDANVALAVLQIAEINRLEAKAKLDEDEGKRLTDLKSKQIILDAQLVKGQIELDNISTNRNTLLINQANAISDRNAKAAKDAKDLADKLAKELLEKEKDTTNKLGDEILKRQQAFNKAELDGIALSRLARDEEFKIEDEKTKKLIDEINKRREAQKLADDESSRTRFEAEEASQREFDAREQIAQQSFNALAGLNDLYYTIAAANGSKDLERQKKQAKVAFGINKAISISSTITQGIFGVVNALTAKSLLPEPIAQAVRVANAVAIGISTAANVAKIASQKFDDSSFTSAASGGGGSISTPSIPNQATPSSFALFGTGGSSNQAGAVDNTGVGAQRVYVLESDITNTQNRVVSLVAEIG
jgi:hypothetical protein